MIHHFVQLRDKVKQRLDNIDDVTVIGRHEVMRCSLDLVLIVWVFASLVILLANVMKNKGYLDAIDLKMFNWVLFFFIGSAVLWVVLARSIGSMWRLYLFSLWVVSLISVLTWFSLSETYTTPIFIFTSCVVVGIFASNIVTSFINMDRPYLAISMYFLTLLFLLILEVTLLIYSEYKHWTIFAAVAFAFLFVVSQLLGIWVYLHHNKHVWAVENTCIFGCMAAWTEVVDAFGLFVSKEKCNNLT